MVFEFIYGIFDGIFAPITSVSPVATVATVATGIALFLTALNKLMVDQNKIKMIRQEMKRLQAEMKKAQDAGDDKKMKKMLGTNLDLTHQQFSLTMRPLMASMVFVMLILPWLRHSFADLSVALPIGLPLVGNAVGWLGLYIIVSMPATVVFRKVMGVQ